MINELIKNSFFTKKSKKGISKEGAENCWSIFNKSQ